MKLFGLIIGSVLAPLVSAAPTPLPQVIDETALLRAIAQKETGNDSRAIGRLFGERSKYQFTRDTWRMHSKLAFAWATDDPELADEIALKHLAYIRWRLRDRGLDETAEHIAAAWHFGSEFAKVCSRGEYVRAVVNLYREEVRR